MEFIIKSRKHGNHTVIVDDEDADRVLKYKWRVGGKYRKDGTFAVKCVRTTIHEKGKRKTVTLHQFICPSDLIDHINNNPLCNEKSNFRHCSRDENARNRKLQKNNSLGYKGVKRRVLKSGKIRYTARIFILNSEKHLGTYDDIKDAALAYNAGAIRYHGEFARLNIV